MPREWSGAAVDPGGGKPAPGEWQSVEVPGRPAAFAGEDRVAYRTVFDDPRDPDEDLGLLELRGLYANAEVWLNDELVAESDAVFAPVKVPFEPDAENELVVECRAPEDRFGGIHDTDRIPADRAVPGIWWGVDVTGQPDPFVVDVDLRPRSTAEGAAIDAAVEVYAGESLDDRLTLTTKPAGDRRGRGMMDRASVSAASGERAVVEKAIEVRDPSLWWPRGMGRQHRYEVRAKLDDAARTSATGIATVEGTDQGGLRVNGEDVPVRGVALADAAVADVERAVEVNANLVRAHAHALPEAVYDACDEAGLLVWQDLPLTGPGEFDAYRGADLAERLVNASESHPALAAVGIHDDPVESYAQGLGSGVLDKLRYRWRAWRAGYDESTANEVADAVEGVPTFPVIGRPGIDPDAATLYPGWEFGSPDALDWVCNHYGLGDVVAEFGAGIGEDGPAEQAATVGRVAEGLRLRESAIACVYALQDASAAGMGLLDGDGNARPAYDRLQAAFEPVQAVLTDPTPGKSDVVVVHDVAEDATVTVEWDVDGEREQTELAVDAFGRETAGSVSLSSGEDVTLAVARDGRVSRNEYSI